MMILAVRRIAALTLFSLLLAACGSSGGSSTPPAPPAPVAPPAPPPEPTFEERLADLAAYDPNSCRASTSGFEALGGWLKNDGRELGASQVWMDDVGQLSDPDSHGASVWATFTACAVRSLEAHYFENADRFNAAIQEDGGDAIQSKSSGLFWEDVPFPEPGRLRPIRDGNSDGQRILYVQGAGNESGKRTAALQAAPFQRALVESDTALWVIVGGYTGEGDNRAPAAQSSICGAADPLCLFAPWSYNGRSGTSHATPQVAAALDTVWTVWPDMDVLDLRNLAFDCAENMPAPAGEESVVREYSYLNGRGVHVGHQLPVGARHPEPHLPVHAERRIAGPHHGQCDLRRDLRAPGRPDHRRLDRGRGLHGPGLRPWVRLPGGQAKLRAGRYGESERRTGDFRR